MENSAFTSLSDEMLSYQKFLEFLLPQTRNRGGDELFNLYKLIHRKYTTNRHYHSIEHIGDCLTNFQLFRESVDASVFGNSQAIFVAIYFHDIICYSGSKTNEEASALVAETCLTVLGCAPRFIQSINRLILVTKHDRIPKTNEEKLIVDIDLLGFALPWDEYYAMTEKIYKEYASLYTKDQFLEGRKKFLGDMFFSRDTIYHTPYFFECEHKARNNFQKFLTLKSL